MVGTVEGTVYPELQVRNDSIFVIYGEKFIRSLDGGQTWQDEYTFDNTIFARDHDFQINSDTIVVFNGGMEYQFFFSTDFGEIWQGPRLCGYYSPGFFFIAMNYHHNAVMMCYSQYITDYLWTANLKISHDFGITWAEPESIWAEANGFLPKLYCYFDRQFILYELGEGYNDTEILLLSRNDNNQWYTIDIFDGSGETGKQSLAASYGGRMAAVYEDANYWYLPPSHILFRCSSDSGRTWNSVVDLSEGRDNYSPKVDLSGDTVAVIWEGKIDSTTYISQLFFKRSYDLGYTWEPLEILTPEEMGEGNPDIVIENGKIHVVSFGRDTTAVWYRFWDPGTDIGNEEENLPSQYTISSYPNPFNASTQISFSLPQRSNVKLEIYDILGRKAESLVNQYLPAGNHSILWQADYLPTGIYFYKITAGEFSETGKMMLIK